MWANAHAVGVFLVGRKENSLIYINVVENRTMGDGRKQIGGGKTKAEQLNINKSRTVVG